MLRRSVAAGLVMVLASCISVDTSTTTTQSVAPTAPATTATTAAATTTTSPPPPLADATSTTVVEETVLQPIPPCLTEEPFFGETGEIDSYSPAGSDSALLATIDWRVWEECERFLFSMASTEGAPTLVPPSALLVMFREHGVLRLLLGPEVETSAISYQMVDTPLVHRIFVLKSPGGGTYVDLHLSEPALARIIPSSGPATLTVDLRPGGSPYSRSAVVTSRAVLLLPEGGTFQYPFAVAGYLRPGSEEWLATITGIDGEAAEAGFPLRGTDDLWLGFTAVFPEGPRGWTTLQVEDAQARLFFEE
ncbi:MAG: hypothetical protein J4G00_05405 [Actinomycetia bacterium]|nr:hypothetical protein [Actinomycetes bacterium]